MKATTLLERQHRSLLQVCEVVERGSPNVRSSLLPQLAGDLAAHFAVEAQLFYPAACAVLHDDSWMRIGLSRHTQALDFLNQTLDTLPDSDEFVHAMHELHALLDRHADEEEAGLFPQLERLLDSAALSRLGRAMMSLYDGKVEAGYGRQAAERNASAPQSVAQRDAAPL